MKRLILGSLVMFGLVSSAFGGEKKEQIDDLMLRWEYIKESNGADYEQKLKELCEKKYDGICRMGDKLEWLAYTDEHGRYLGYKLAREKYKENWDFDAVIRSVDIALGYEEVKIKRNGAIKSYNQFKKEMAKCRLSGKICVEE